MYSSNIPNVGVLDGHSLINDTTEANSEVLSGFAEHNAEIADNAKFK